MSTLLSAAAIIAAMCSRIQLRAPLLSTSWSGVVAAQAEEHLPRFAGTAGSSWGASDGWASCCE